MYIYIYMHTDIYINIYRQSHTHAHTHLQILCVDRSTSNEEHLRHILKPSHYSKVQCRVAFIRNMKKRNIIVCDMALYMWHASSRAKQKKNLAPQQNATPCGFHTCDMKLLHMTWLFTCVTWLCICMTQLKPLTAANCSATSPSFVWHDLSTCSFVWHDSFLCVTCLIRMCATTPKFKCATTRLFILSKCSAVSPSYVWLMHMRDMTENFYWCICVTWLKNSCGVATISRLLKNIGLFCRI